LNDLRQSDSPEVVVLCWEKPSDSDYCAQKIVSQLGGETRFVCMTTDGIDSVPPGKCLIVNAESLARAGESVQGGPAEILRLLTKFEHVLVYGFQPSDRHDALVKACSAGGLSQVQRIPGNDVRFKVADGYREFCGQLSGVAIGTAVSTRDASFVASGSGPAADVMIRAGEQPFFVRTTVGGSQVCLCACRDLADLDEKVRRGMRPSAWFSRLAPALMFLRGALRDRIWHNQRAQACIIIDDPLVKSRYGFLEYRRLLELMRRKNFSACIAFIPWNYRRSSREVGTLINSSYERPFLCVHGCDHTHYEFASSDLTSLRSKARIALERMSEHVRLSGIPFDDVMVFPQGRYSAEAVTALKDAGYLAAANGDVCPATSPETWTLRDLVSVVVTKFAGFPLFGRRYPRDLSEFAFDLFLGKPALVAEHHDYFRDGYRALETFVTGLNSLDENLQWSNLASVCSQTCLARTGADGAIHVRFYTHRFSLTNSGVEAKKYVLHTHHTGPEAPVVTVNGQDYAREAVPDGLQIRLALGAGETAEIRVEQTVAESGNDSWKPTDVYNAKVRMRRYLGEFRDNYVDTVLVLSRMLAATRAYFSRRRAAKETRLGTLRPMIAFFTMLPALETLSWIASEFGALCD